MNNRSAETGSTIRVTQRVVTDVVLDAHSYVPVEAIGGAPAGQYRSFWDGALMEERNRYSTGPFRFGHDPKGAVGSWALFLECYVVTEYGDMTVKINREPPSDRPRSIITDVNMVVYDLMLDAADPLEKGRPVFEGQLLSLVETPGGRVEEGVPLPTDLGYNAAHALFAEQSLCLGWLRACFPHAPDATPQPGAASDAPG